MVNVSDVDSVHLEARAYFCISCRHVARVSASFQQLARPDKDTFSFFFWSIFRRYCAEMQGSKSALSIKMLHGVSLLDHLTLVCQFKPKL